jgi:hypothetical protein
MLSVYNSGGEKKLPGESNFRTRFSKKPDTRPKQIRGEEDILHGFILTE